MAKVSFQIASKEERSKGRVWASLSYWSIVLMFIGYLVNRRNRLFRYHLGQAVALRICMYIVALFAISLKELAENDAVTRGLAITFSFIGLLFIIEGTSNAWNGKLHPLPIFGNSLGQLVMVFLQRAEPVIENALTKIRSAADHLT
jgi:uncharacterized membrane protein